MDIILPPNAGYFEDFCFNLCQVFQPVPIVILRYAGQFLPSFVVLGSRKCGTSKAEEKNF